MNAQQRAETVEEALEGLVADERPARRIRRRPLALQPKPGDITWLCPCEGCRDLVAAQIKRLTDAPAAEPATLHDSEPLSESWLELCAVEDESEPATPTKRRGGLRFVQELTP